MDKPPAKIRRSLLPFSWLYGIAVNFRNRLYDRKILKSTKYETPVICVGNLTVGGTGKTPHIEYLIRLLSPKYRVAVLSRGYKRKTRDFRIVETTSHVREVGDEPLQIKQKFPEILVVVDRNRRNAIRKMEEMPEDKRPDVILLDDGFQHRRVQPSLSILLVDCNRPVYEDVLLPAGSLREPLSGKHRASVVVVTKCPSDMAPIDFRIYANGLNLFPFQELYFTGFDYGDVYPVFPDVQEQVLSPHDLRKKQTFLVTGIASPQPMVEKLELRTYNLYPLHYPDHHFYTESDIMDIQNKLDEIDDDNKIIVTTEKDAIRFRALTFLSDEIKSIMYYIPIKVDFLEESEQKSFNNKIIQHVRNYQANSRLSKRKN